MKKLLLTILLIAGLNYSQGIDYSMIYLIENYAFSTINVATITTDTTTINQINITDDTDTYYLRVASDTIGFYNDNDARIAYLDSLGNAWVLKDFTAGEDLVAVGDVDVGDDVLIATGGIIGITGEEIITFTAGAPGTINITGATFDVDGAATATSFTADAALGGTSVVIEQAAPVLQYKDTDGDDADVNAYIDINLTATGTNAENADLQIYQQVGGNALRTYFSDADAGIWRYPLGSSTNFSAITANEQRLSSATPSIDFYDTQGDDGDVSAQLDVDLTATGTGAENADVSFSQQVGGNMTAFLTADADGTLDLGSATQNTTVLGALTVSGDILASAATHNIGATGTRFNLAWADSVHANWFGGSDFELGESGSDITIDADSLKGSPVWAGNLVVEGNQSLFGEMEGHASAGTLVITQAAQNHGVEGEMSAGDLNGFTFTAGSVGVIADIASIAANDSIAISDASHGLVTGDYIAVQSANHSGLVVVTRIDADSFHVDINFVGDETGTWQEGDFLTASAGTAGKYLICMDFTTSAGAASKEYHFHAIQNTTELSTSFVITTRGTQHQSGHGNSIATVTAGDRFWLVVQNETDTQTLEYEDSHMILVKL